MIWTEPIHLSSVESDIGVNEADMCALPSGLVVVAALSTFTYTVSMWAIDPQKTPVIGPRTVFFQESYAPDPTPNPIDPKAANGVPIDDLCMVIPVGDYTFAISGDLSTATYNAAGEPDDAGLYAHVASFYTVNPDDLTITRTGWTVGDTNVFYTTEVNSARWGNKVVLLPEANSIPYRIGVAGQDGSLRVITHATASPGFNTGPGPIAVSGNIGVYPMENGQIRSFDLNTGTILQTLNADFGQDPHNWSMSATTLPDGRIAVVVPNTSAGTFFSFQPVAVAIITPSPLAVTVWPVAASGLTVGPFGAWYQMVRSVTSWTDGTVLVSYAVGDRMRITAINPNTGVILFDEQVSTFLRPQGNYLAARSVGIGYGQAAAIWLTNRPADYGVYYAQTPPFWAAGDLIRTERRFVHRADRT